MTDVGGTLFFVADDGVHGQELWKTDGSKAGTVLVKDINPGGSGGGQYRYGPLYLTAVGDTLFFTADDGTHGRELWKSDGTTAGTVMVKDITHGNSPYVYGPTGLTDVGGTLFFADDDGTHGTELWKSDGTKSGTVMVKDITPGGSQGGYEYGPSSLTDVGGTLFFSDNDGTHGTELWKSDGTMAGTVLVKNINFSDYSSYPNGLTDVGGTLFFSARDGVHGQELWKSDGTKAGTVMVKDITPGPNQYGYSYGPTYLTAVGGTLFFTDDDGTHGREIWKSDGTTSGTVMVKDITPGHGQQGYNYGPSNLTDVGGTLFFSDDDGVDGRELWKSDGTRAGTVMVKNIDPGAYGSSPDGLADVGGTLFFSARDGVHGPQLWKSDGSTAGTLMVKVIHPCAAHSGPEGLVDFEGTVFFAADDGVHGQELWKSDGTSAGTVLVKDINKAPVGTATPAKPDATKAR